jgi:hypothetical protein
VNEFTGLEFGEPGPNCAIPNEETELALLDMADAEIWEQFVALAIMFVVYGFLAYIFLRFLYKEKR